MVVPNSDFINQTLTEDMYSEYMDKENISYEWMFMGSPIPVLTVIAFYLLVVLKLGPSYMKDREPYKLKQVMRIYNIVQVVYNFVCLYIFLTPYENVPVPIWYLLKNSCTDPRLFYLYNSHVLRYLYLMISWYVLGLKILDLFDTVFMILRKKTSHVTFLHVYHHAGTVFLVWFTFKYYKPIQGAIPVFLNMFVHAVMYSYYFLATFDSFKKYLWWKKHLTKLQVTQLVIIIAYLSVVYYNQCPVSRHFTYIWIFNVFVNLFLFLNFYVRTYVMKPTNVTKSEKKID